MVRAQDRVKTKRVYQEPEPDDGYRILVDRLWPRGVKKANLKLDDWAKDIAPSMESAIAAAQRRSRREFATTSRLLQAMAAAAIAGVIRPRAARGMATPL